MSLKISQIKDFFFIQQIRSRGEFLHSSCYEPDFFFPFFFLFFILFFVFAMGVATVGQKHLHAYIQCILQRYNKSVCDRISQKPHLFPLSHVQFWLKHISLQHLNIQRANNVVKVKHRVQTLASALLIVNEGRKQIWTLLLISFISHFPPPKLPPPPKMSSGGSFFIFSTVSH